MKPLMGILLAGLGLGLALTSAGQSPAGAGALADVATGARQDLAVALDELAALNRRIAAEQAPLAARLRELEVAVLDRRREAARWQRRQDDRELNRGDLEGRVRAREAEQEYLLSLFRQYAENFEARLHIAELANHTNLLATAAAALQNPTASPSDQLVRQLAVAATALDRIAEQLGGTRYPGRALTREGLRESGQFVQFGPVAVFAGSDGGSAGPAVLQLGAADPVVVAVEPGRAEGIRDLVATGRGELPVDPTLGNALKMAATRETWWDHVRKGGPVMVPLLALALFATGISLFKWRQFAGLGRVQPADLAAVLGLVRQGDAARARERARSVRGPAGELLVAAVDHAHQRKELLEEVLYERLLATKPRLERLLPFIALAAATAPLLGLLGTVTGMINTFRLISVFGTGDPRVLSSGISEALVTTEYGLIIAVPCLLVHALLQRRSRGLIANLEQTAVSFINGAPGDEENR